MSCLEPFEQSEAAKSIFGKAPKIIKRNLREEFILTRYQVAMPLFVCDSIYETANEYDQLARRTGSKAVSKLAKYHTAEKYFYIDEPLGRVTHIPASELQDTLNLMLHLGIISIDGEGYLECQHYDERARTWVVKRWLTDKDKVDRTSGILFETFERDPSSHSELMVHLLDLTTKLLACLASVPTHYPEDLRIKSQKIAIGYITDETYPLIPETLLQNRLLKEPVIAKLFQQKHISDGYKTKKINVSRSLDRTTAFRSLDEMLVATNFEYPDLLRRIREGRPQSVAPSTPSDSSIPTEKTEQKTMQPEVKTDFSPSGGDRGDDADQEFERLRQKLNRMAQLVRDGTLTEEEFREFKKQVMDKYVHQ
jgi:hypothetical protein